MNDWKKLENENTLDLINLFQDRCQPERLRNSAFLSLTYRFREDLLKKCEIVCKRFRHDITVAEQIAESTFASYAIKGDFKIEKANPSDIDGSFKIYLYAIARNELTNYYRLQQKKEKGYFYDGSESIIKDIPEISVEKLTDEQKIILRAIKSLSPQHRVVYLTYKQHERIGCNLPKNLLFELREFLGGVKQGTIRSYKKEAVDKINQYLEVMNLTKEISDEKF